MHLEIIDQKRVQILQTLSKIASINKFSIGGGTGLSFQLGLRESYDFDFFTSEHFSIDELLDDIISQFGDRVEVITKRENRATLDLYIDDVKVSFFEYQYENLEPVIKFDEFAPLTLLSIEDIACMKIVAIIQRGTKKDFFDMYFILKKLKCSAKGLLNLLESKYHDNSLLTGILYSIAYFDDAENDILPQSFVDYSWDEMKKAFIKLQNEFCKEILIQ